MEIEEQLEMEELKEEFSPAQFEESKKKITYIGATITNLLNQNVMQSDVKIRVVIDARSTGSKKARPILTINGLDDELNKTIVLFLPVAHLKSIKSDDRTESFMNFGWLSFYMLSEIEFAFQKQRPFANVIVNSQIAKSIQETDYDSFEGIHLVSSMIDIYLNDLFSKRYSNQHRKELVACIPQNVSPSRTKDFFRGYDHFQEHCIKYYPDDIGFRHDENYYRTSNVDVEDVIHHVSVLEYFNKQLKDRDYDKVLADFDGSNKTLYPENFLRFVVGSILRTLEDLKTPEAIDDSVEVDPAEVPSTTAYDEYFDGLNDHIVLQGMSVKVTKVDKEDHIKDTLRIPKLKMDVRVPRSLFSKFK